MKKDEDLSIAGPGSPISLKKFRALHPPSMLDKDGLWITVMLDQSSIGIARDDPQVCCITIDDCKAQTRWFRDEVFMKNGKKMSVSLMRHLLYFYPGKEYKTNKALLKALEDKELTAESPEYIQVQNLMEYSEFNQEAIVLIGFLMLIEGSLSLAHKEGKRVTFYLEYVDSTLHPQRSWKFMYVLNGILKQYKLPDLPTPDNDEDDGTAQESDD